jgi:hypothetical protein
VHAARKQRKQVVADEKAYFLGPAEMVALATISAHVVAKATIFWWSGNGDAFGAILFE